MADPDAVIENPVQERQILCRQDATDGPVVAILTAIAGILRLAQISKKSFWFDEGVSVAIARLDWYNFVRLLWRREANMSLYYLLLRGWLHFGHSEGFIRALSVLAGVASIPVLYYLGRQLFDRRVGLIAAALLSVNAFHVAYSQEARSYALFVLLGTLSVLYFVRSVQDPSAHNRRAHIAVSVLAVYAHFFAVLLIVAEWLSLKFYAQRDVSQQLRKSWRWMAGLSAPVLIFLAATGAGPLAWIPRPGLHDIYRLSLWLCGDGGWVLLLIYVLSCLPAWVVTAANGTTDTDRWKFRLLFLWLAFPLGFVFLVSQVRPLFLDRYFLFLTPGLALTASAGLVRLPSKWLTGLGLALLLVFSLSGLRNYYDHDFDLEHEDWRTATRYVLDRAQPGDGILFHTGMGRMPYEYYRWDASGPRVIFGHHDERITFRDFYGHPDEAFLSAIPSRYPRVWVVFSHNHVGLGLGTDALSKHMMQMFEASYTKSEIRSFAGVEIYLYSDSHGAANTDSLPGPPSSTSNAVQAPH